MIAQQEMALPRFIMVHRSTDLTAIYGLELVVTYPPNYREILEACTADVRSHITRTNGSIRGVPFRVLVTAVDQVAGPHAFFFPRISA